MTKIIKMPPRNAKDALVLLAEEHGKDMKHFVVIGCDNEDLAFCYTNCDSIQHLAMSQVILGQLVAHSLETEVVG